ncbi:oxidoreductase [Microdochium trichocladiopsis]|uniref:Oxidoreductase n=1 Tax=Microdochium trichocladiopsis TaxID=1682393 RepID=A0A9P9BSR9_9PEZI|nr:oxidoreductase [Microdochium trichocladiopsis]KAH7029111.1 oxidoreductase [Microdochium trichocladiopsis]
MSLTSVLVAAILSASGASASAIPSRQFARQDASIPLLTWQLLPTGSTQQFRGLAPVSDQIAWVSGTNGTVLKTVDGGSSWTSVGPSLSEADATLQFRDVQAWSAERAVILSIGEGSDSRIYITSDGGATWTQTFVSEEEKAFYNCVDFDTEQHGFAVSDPVNGKFRLIETFDGGASWAIVDSSGMPPALELEAGFSASGTCLETAGGRWYAAAGGVDPGRVFASPDGHVWSVADSTIDGGEASGVFTIQFRDARHGIALGGNFSAPTGNVNNAAWSDDGGLSWTAAAKFPGGYRSGSTWVPGLCKTAIAVGPTGSDVSVDGGRTWHGFYNGSFDSVECVNAGACWASGSGGRVARLSFE